MPTVEDELTDLLSRRAAALPANPRLLAEVKARSHRNAVRHRVGVAVLAAAAVVAVAVVPWVVLGGADGPAVTAIGSPASGPSVFLAKAPPVTPSFPLTPAHLPAGLTPHPVLSHEPGMFLASYASMHGGGSGIDLQTFAIRQPPDQSRPALAATVHGHPAVLVVDVATRYASVTWLAKPAQWVKVTGYNEWGTREVVLGIANSLRDKAMTGAPQFKVALAPPGFALDSYFPGGITLSPPAGRPKPPASSPAGIAVQVHRGSAATAGRGKSVRVGSHAGWLATARDGTYHLVLTISDALQLEVTAPPASAPWNADELGRFAAGITFSGSPPQ